MTLWTENELSDEKVGLKKGLTVYAVCAAFYLALSVVLLVLSKGKEYFWFMAGDIALSVAFGWGSLWYFTNPFHERKSLIALYGKMAVSPEYTETGSIKDICEITKGGLLLYSVTINLGEQERVLNAFTKTFVGFEKGKSYVFKTRANVIVAGEEK